MLGVTRVAPGHNGDNYVARVLRALGWQRLAVLSFCSEEQHQRKSSRCVP